MSLRHHEGYYDTLLDNKIGQHGSTAGNSATHQTEPYAPVPICFNRVYFSGTSHTVLLISSRTNRVCASMFSFDTTAQKKDEHVGQFFAPPTPFLHQHLSKRSRHYYLAMLVYCELLSVNKSGLGKEWRQTLFVNKCTTFLQAQKYVKTRFPFSDFHAEI